MHRRIAALLICALMALSLGGAWAEASLSLPSELREIGAEAFMGLPGPGKVTVPEGVEAIKAWLEEKLEQRGTEPYRIPYPAVKRDVLEQSE